MAMLGGLLTLASGATSAVAATSPRVSVAPRVGTPATRFRVRFPNPIRTGNEGSFRLSETVVAIGPKPTAGCAAAARRHVVSSGSGRWLHVRLAPTSGRWCPGIYAGTVVLYRKPRCPPGPLGVPHACPLFVPAPERIGGFRFRVRHAPS
jgi:hypothetical protein